MSDPKDTGDLRDDTTPPEVVVGPLSPAIRDAIDEARVAQIVALGGPLEGD